MKLIGFTGLPRAGKDTAAEYLATRWDYVRYSFAGPLKAAAAILLGCTERHTNGLDGFDREAPLPSWSGVTNIKSMRDFLQRFGTESIRDVFGTDFWVHRMRGNLKGPRRVERAAITDVRFENEVALIHELGGYVVEIYRPGSVASDHASDKGVRADATIINDGTGLDLHAATLDVVKHFYGSP